MSEADTYPQPAHGWTCFHCGETFTTSGSARDHFGFAPSDNPACRIKIGEERGLAMALRRAEAELERYRAEDSDTDRRIHAMASDHAQAMRRAEEEGYARGLADGRAERITREATPAADAPLIFDEDNMIFFGFTPQKPAGPGTHVIVRDKLYVMHLEHGSANAEGTAPDQPAPSKI